MITVCGRAGARLFTPLALLVATAALAQAPGLDRITAIEVRDGQVRIVGSKRPSFTTFNLGDPPRLVIDFSEAVLAGVPSELPQVQGAVTGIRTMSYGSDTAAIARVLIGFDHDVDTHLHAEGNTLVVTFGTQGPRNVARTTPPPVQTTVPVKPPPADAGVGLSAEEAARSAQAQREADERAAADAKARAETARAAAEGAAKRAQEERLAQDQAAQRAREAEAAQAAADARAREEAARRAQAEKEAQEKAAAEAKAKAEQRAQAEREAQARAAAEEKARQEAARRAEAQRQAEEKAAAEAKARAQEAQREEAARQKAAEEAAAKRAEQERQAQEARAEAARKAAQAREEAKARAEAEARAKAEAAAQAKAERQARAEAARQAREEAAREAAREKAAAQERAAQAKRDAQAKAAQEAQARREAQAKAAQETAARREAQARAKQEEIARREAARKAAAEARQEEAGTPPGEAGPHRVLELVGFRPTQGGSRVFVKTNGPVQYAVSQPSDREIDLELQNTGLGSRTNALPLDTEFFDTPVTRVVPMSVGGAVRIRILLRRAAPFEVHPDGDQISVEFQQGAPR